MKKVDLPIPLVGFIAATRALLGAGIGLPPGGQIPPPHEALRRRDPRRARRADDDPRGDRRVPQPEEDGNREGVLRDGLICSSDPSAPPPATLAVLLPRGAEG